MPIRQANAHWTGGLKEGQGDLSLGSGAFKGPYSFKTRFEDTPGANPEELLGAALAACYSMALSAALGDAKLTPDRIDTNAKVHFDFVDGKPTVTKIDLDTAATIPGIDDAKFQDIAKQTKANCPISRALAAVDIVLTAKLN